MSEELRVLIVDDNEDFCRSLADILVLRDHEVSCAYSGFHAVEEVQQNSFDLVVTDIKMPEMNGVETFKKIRGIRPEIPVLMMTGFSVDDLIGEALREGVLGVLRKPVDHDEMFRLIEEATAGRDSS